MRQKLPVRLRTQSENSSIQNRLLGGAAGRIPDETGTGLAGNFVITRWTVVSRTWFSPLYSCRSAHIGSIMVARRAGIQQAIPAVTVTNAAALQRYAGFPDSSPARKLRRACRTGRAAPNPIVRPTAIVAKP